ncbi:MAG: lysophospholipid acyltransferase family protein [Anaerolineales bacterium]
MILKIDSRELDKIPPKGPLLGTANHINFLDVPVILSHLYPRPMTVLAKKETWDNPIIGFLFNIWDGIPIDREIADFSAFRKSKQVLKEGKILAFSPEGTRTGIKGLIQAKPGVAMLAIQCNVPIQPVAYYGHEHFWAEIKRLKRAKMTFRVGQRFRINLNGQLKNKEMLQHIADAIMLEIAKLMPEEYHGFYANKTSPGSQFIEYLE